MDVWLAVLVWVFYFLADLNRDGGTDKLKLAQKFLSELNFLLIYDLLRTLQVVSGSRDVVLKGLVGLLALSFRDIVSYLLRSDFEVSDTES